ncbi:MAG TPA: DUF4010 domain-containing protein [Desulfobulbus sp.]|nr:DUF4010 domain-containing protein [Desulfobulbus sp.]
MNLPADVIHFIVTTVLGFLSGLEVKSYRQQFHPESTTYFFGTVRTTTFLALLGFVLYVIDSQHLVVYTAGLLSFTAIFALFYAQRLRENKTSVLLYMVSLAVYTYGPLTILYPLWMPALLFVLIVFLLNARTTISDLSSRINARELESLGKMVLLSVVILPLLPDSNVIPYIPLSPFKIWLAVVVISAISYGGYISQKYLVPGKGIFLTGLIGGTYSSTATTVVLAKRAREEKADAMMTASIIAATSVMYLRLIVVAFVFNHEIARSVLIPFLLFAGIGFVVALLYYRSGNRTAASLPVSGDNPLELGTAFLFAALFIVMIMLTHAVTRHYGVGGLKIFSFLAGFTDIDPFILSLLTGKYTVGHQELFAAILISAGSNNILKAAYALWFGSWQKTRQAFLWLTLLGAATIAAGLAGPLL